MKNGHIDLNSLRMLLCLLEILKYAYTREPPYRDTMIHKMSTARGSTVIVGHMYVICRCRRGEQPLNNFKNHLFDCDTKLTLYGNQVQCNLSCLLGSC